MPIFRTHTKLITFCILSNLLLLLSCTNNNIDPFEGVWRAVFHSPGGELPFAVHISRSESGGHRAYVVNGKEKLHFTTVSVNENKIVLGFDQYDSFINAEIDVTGNTLKGEWRRRSLNNETSKLDFSAEKNNATRFTLNESNNTSAIADISGSWVVEFVDEDGPFDAIGQFEQNGNHVAGTFLTSSGDYRFLEGVYANGELKLSCFDGGHAFLFKAKVENNGKMQGDFWSRDVYHATWTAEKGVEGKLPDSFEITNITTDDKRFEFEFPDLDGNLITHEDPRFKGKPLLIVVYGTWCPNCNDEAQFLLELYDKYHPKGLEIIGFANEYTGIFEEDAKMVKQFVKLHDIKWPQLLVGLAENEKTKEALKHLNVFKAYPTTLFIDKNGVVRKIHTGFSGPATGKYYEQLKKDFVALIESIIE